MRGICIRASTPIFNAPYPTVMQDEILFGQEAELFEQRGAFCRIATYYGYEGYAEHASFLPLSEAALHWRGLQKVAIAAPFSCIRAMPFVQSRVFINVPRASFVAPSGEIVNGFARVAMPNGAYGYVNNADIYKIPPNISPLFLRQALCRTALSYIGCQYLWGGKTPMGIDCSGLVSACYLMHGIIIYRDAKLMRNYAAHAISAQSLKAADLIYFTGHIAMYLGSGRFIHSTAHEKARGVCVASFNSLDTCFRADLSKSVLGMASVF